MGRPPCCDEVGVKKGPWTPEEDKKLVDYIQEHGHGGWRNLPKSAGLNRCGKSCRLRWTNYLRPDIKRGKFAEEEERLIIHLHSIVGNKWSAIAARLPGRTDNEIKNYWNTHLKKKLLLMGIDPVTHRRRTDLDILASLPSLLAAANISNMTAVPWDNALRLQADAAHLARLQLLHSLIQTISPNSTASLCNNQFGDFLQMNRQLEAVLDGSLSLSQDLNPTPSSLSNLSASYFGKNVATELAIDGEVVICPDQMNNFYGSMITTTNPAPSLVPASPENVTNNQMQEPINSNDMSVNSSSSTPFEAWEGQYPEDDLCWKDILDQIAWSNNGQ